MKSSQTSYTYTSLIQVLIKSDDPSAAGEQADKYLQEMKAENIKPDKFVYTSMIKAWSKRKDQKAKERIKALKSDLKQLDQRRKVVSTMISPLCI